MRIENVTTSALNYSIIYPDELVFLGDTNYVQIAAQRRATIDVSVSILTYVAHYISETGNVVIDISSLLRRAAAIDRTTITVTVNNRDFTFTSYVCRGCTDGDRYHGSARKIVLPSVINSVELLVINATNSVTINGTTRTNETLGVRSYTAPNASATAKIQYSNLTLKFGDFFDPKGGAQIFDIEVVDCHPKDGAIIRWYDHDGCKRYLVGRVMRRGESVQFAEYNAALTTIRSVAGAKVTDCRRTLTIGFPQVSKDVHLEELLDSDEIVIVNPDTLATIPVIPAFTSLDCAMAKDNNFELQFVTKI